MRMMFMTAGSRGDVDPFIALARRAQSAGHEVRVAVTGDFVGHVQAAGLDVAGLDGDYSALVGAQGASAWAAMRSFRTVIRPMMAGFLRSAADAALSYRPDVLVHHPKVLSAPLAAARLGIPHVLVEIVPTITPTRQFPAAGVTGRDLGRLNPLTYRFVAGAGAMFAGPLREIRADLGLPVRGEVPGPALTLVPVSPTLLPRPGDWPGTTQITGAWLEPVGAGSAVLDADLDAFLGSGEVVYAGFGSMALGDASARGAAVAAAVRASGRRLLAVTGWGGLRVPPDLVGEDVLVREAVPHAEVLERCVAAVHHGGAGTVHAAVRAGVVSVCVPFLADQPFWGALLHRRGFSAAPVPVRRLTAARLGTALGTLPDPAAVRAAARAMAAEDGCGTALAALEQRVGR
ncbi:glycosyltransferase [Pseudonocardia humida]|uniref:Glycosyltransferase family 1 protein n=1 Tax=Pseudonocardia humida TaxID=2800819 RepID=A0ABT1AC19_9PSEU|nr:glycosyltransferase [Pseudonocardia humida]MCO1660579.1 glycosyltransferase family 1 protein [Pseudonocardia humida]